jgi:hypothetical protein
MPRIRPSAMHKRAIRSPFLFRPNLCGQKQPWPPMMAGFDRPFACYRHPHYSVQVLNCLNRSWDNTHAVHITTLLCLSPPIVL